MSERRFNQTRGVIPKSATQRGKYIFSTIKSSWLRRRETTVSSHYLFQAILYFLSANTCPYFSRILLTTRKIGNGALESYVTTFAKSYIAGNKIIYMILVLKI